jgi:hypothetical protein
MMWGQVPRPIGSIALVSTLLVSGLGVSVPANAARAVDCLSAPNSAAPQNGRWHYRTDRAKQRKCWYLRVADRPSQQAVRTTREAPPAKQSVPAADQDSLTSFKSFMALRGDANLSERDLKKLHAQFLEWSRHAKN